MESKETPKKSFKDYVKKLYPFLLIFVELPIWTYNTLPCPISPVEFSIPPIRTSFPGTTSLGQMTKLYYGHIEGPSSFVIKDDHIYTGTQDGYVNDLNNGTIRKLTKFGSVPCGASSSDVLMEETCGRPMGLRMDNDGSLLVVDAYHGLFRVNIENGSYSTLYASSTPVSGVTSKFLIDLDIAPDGRIYFLEFSTKFPKSQVNYEFLEMSSTGRLLMYNPRLDMTIQIVDNIPCPTGIQLDKAKTGLLITSALLHGIYRYDLTSRQLSVWTDGLPGSPSTIRYSSDTDSYWLGLNLQRSAGSPNLLDKIAGSSFFFRRFCAKVFSIDLLQILASNFRWFGQGSVAEIAVDGTLRRLVQDSTGQGMGQVHEVQNVRGALYLGSSDQTDFIGRVQV